MRAPPILTVPKAVCDRRQLLAGTATWPVRQEADAGAEVNQLPLQRSLRADVAIRRSVSVRSEISRASSTSMPR